MSELLLIVKFNTTSVVLDKSIWTIDVEPVIFFYNDYVIQNRKVRRFPSSIFEA